LPHKAIRQAEDNFARRLVGKYFLDNTEGKFWSNGFRKISRDVLYPQDDEYLELLQSILPKLK
jgi:hypothetical protein